MLRVFHGPRSLALTRTSRIYLADETARQRATPVVASFATRPNAHHATPAFYNT
jgi:hypothetical protein